MQSARRALGSNSDYIAGPKSLSAAAADADPMTMKVSPRNPTKMSEVHAILQAPPHRSPTLAAKSNIPPQLPSLNITPAAARMNVDVLDSDNYFYRRPTLSNGAALVDSSPATIAATKSPRLTSLSPRERGFSGGEQLSPRGAQHDSSTSPQAASSGSFHRMPSGSGSFAHHPLDVREVPQKPAFDARPSFLTSARPSRDETLMLAKELITSQT